MAHWSGPERGTIRIEGFWSQGLIRPDALLAAQYLSLSKFHTASA